MRQRDARLAPSQRERIRNANATVPDIGNRSGRADLASGVLRNALLRGAWRSPLSNIDFLYAGESGTSKRSSACGHAPSYARYASCCRRCRQVWSHNSFPRASASHGVELPLPLAILLRLLLLVLLLLLLLVLVLLLLLPANTTAPAATTTATVASANFKIAVCAKWHVLPSEEIDFKRMPLECHYVMKHIVA